MFIEYIVKNYLNFVDKINCYIISTYLNIKYDSSKKLLISSITVRKCIALQTVKSMHKYFADVPSWYDIPPTVAVLPSKPF